MTEVVPDNAGNPVTTTDPLGRVTTRTFDAFERVTLIEEPGRTTELVYDANGNKLSETVSGVDSPARTRRFVYDAANRNTAFTDGAGQVSHSAYFPNGEVRTRTDARGGTVRLVLDAANRVIETRGPRPEQVATASYDGVGNRIAERLVNGREITHRYDPLHRLQSSRDSLGEFLRRSYDADGNLTSATDALGATTSYTVNDLNQRSAAAAPEGRDQAWTYSVHDEVLTEQSPTAAITTHRYDAFGQRIETVLPSGSGADQPRRWSYDLAGNVKTQTDSKGITASFDYDTLNRRIRAQINADDGGQAETWRYDARDNAISHRDRAGIEETFRYDGEDRRLTRTRAGSLRESNSYDPNGNLLTQTDANGNTSTFAYDAANQRSSRSVPGPSGPETETWTYTASNQIESHTDAEGQRSTFAYDPRERVIEEVNAENETRHYQYDGNGNRTTITLPNGETWTQGFDSANRLTRIASPEGHVTRYTYHPDDQLARITDGNGHSVQLQSDALARIRERVYPGGAAFTTQYDGEGNAVQDSRPDSSIHRQFDPLNRVKSASYTAIAGNAASVATTYDPNGNPTTVVLDQDSRQLRILRSYDDQNRLEREETDATALPTIANVTPAVIPANAGTQLNTPARSATNPSSNSTSTSTSTSTPTSAIPQPYTHTQRYALDGNGNRVTVTDAANTTTQQTFDAQNRLLSSTTAGEGSSTHRWNKNGTLQSIDHGNGSTTRYQYDRAQRIQEITHTQNGATTLAFVYTYDRNGNRIGEVKTQSAINGQAGSITTTTYAYDRDDRLISTTVSHQPSDTSTPDERSDWTLDAVGNRLTETVTRLADNTTTSSKQYVYSDRDQLLTMTDTVNQLTVAYSYDQNGNRTQRTVTRQGQPPETTTYTFDARDRLTGVQPNAPNTANAPTIAYQYDADGRRIERIAFPATGQNPAVTLYLYNGSSLLHEAIPDASATSPNSAGLRLTDTYRTSVKLDRHLAFDLAGNASVRFYQLDALDTPVAMTDAAGNTVTRTTFDAWGNIEQQIAGGVTQTPWQLPNYNPDQTGQAALLSSDGQVIGFTGYQKDSDTGLYYAGARWYDPLVGNFNGMDPAQGRTETPVSFHRYLYANGNPLFFVDLTGMESMSAEEVAMQLQLLAQAQSAFDGLSPSLRFELTSGLLDLDTGRPSVKRISADSPPGSFEKAFAQAIFRPVAASFRVVPRINLAVGAIDLAVAVQRGDKRGAAVATLETALPFVAGKALGPSVEASGLAQGARSEAAALESSFSSTSRTSQTAGRTAPGTSPNVPRIEDRIAQLSAQDQATIKAVSSFQTNGVTRMEADVFLSTTPEGQAFLRLAKTSADRSLAPGQVVDMSKLRERAIDQIRSGSNLPALKNITSPIVKVVPTGGEVSSFTPFFTTQSELNRAILSGRRLADFFGLPTTQNANRFGVFSIQPKGVATVFESEVAPTTELGGQFTTRGGGVQLIVPDRSQFNPAVFQEVIDDNL
ncbi:MAG: RHS repeat-associated core domain-containing protein [Porticoccaceae bacterium]